MQAVPAGIQTINSKFVAFPVLEGLDRLEGFIREGLAVLESKTNDGFSYSRFEEDCTSGSGTLFIVVDDSIKKMVGFFVLSPVVENGRTAVHVRSAYSRIHDAYCLLELGLQTAIDFGIMIGAAEIAFSSPRKGWLKTAKKLGYRLTRFGNGIYEFSKEIDHAKF